jgi:hypothetical protein
METLFKRGARGDEQCQTPPKWVPPQPLPPSWGPFPSTQHSKFERGGSPLFKVSSGNFTDFDGKMKIKYGVGSPLHRPLQNGVIWAPPFQSFQGGGTPYFIFIFPSKSVKFPLETLKRGGDPTPSNQHFGVVGGEDPTPYFIFIFTSKPVKFPTTLGLFRISSSEFFCPNSFK